VIPTLLKTIALTSTMAITVVQIKAGTPGQVVSETNSARDHFPTRLSATEERHRLTYSPARFF